MFVCFYMASIYVRILLMFCLQHVTLVQNMITQLQAKLSFARRVPCICNALYKDLSHTAVGQKIDVFKSRGCFVLEMCLLRGVSKAKLLLLCGLCQHGRGTCQTCCPGDVWNGKSDYWVVTTVCSHNFNSRNYKSRVSNPISKNIVMC